MIDKVVSLGSLCHTAYFLKTSKVRTESYPFDWVFAGPHTVLKCLTDNFQAYLDKNLYIDSPNGPGKCGHKLFAASFFNHRDARDPENYEFYCRSVDRFRALLATDLRKLFIIGLYNTSCDLNGWKSQILLIAEQMKELTTNYEILVVFHKQGSTREARWSEDSENRLVFLEIQTTKPTSGISFENVEDDLFFASTILTKFQIE